MAEETTVNTAAIVSNLGNAETVDKQADIIAKGLLASGLGGAVELMSQLHEKALDDLGYARGFLLLVDLPLLTKALGPQNLEKLRFAMKKSQRVKPIDDLMDRVRTVDGATLTMAKAKSAMMFQLLYLLRERISEEGMAELRMTAADVVNMALDRDDIKNRELVVDLENFGKGYWTIFIDLLKEADFRADDKQRYTMVLSDAAVRRAADGLELVSSGKGGEGGKLSETVLARMGSNIIKRLSLLLRTVKIYSSADHPSITLALESLQGTIDQMLKDREKLTLSRLGGDILVEDVRLKKTAPFLEDFARSLEERNINSITLRKGISLDEVRTFVMIFGESAAAIRNRGGVRGILQNKGVTHVVVDQFRYGIIEDEGQVPQKDDLASDERALENLVFTEIVSKIKAGGSVGDVSAEEVAKAFSSLVSGRFRKDQKSRAALAQMILSLDPSLADQALFASGGLRDAMSWSTARTTIDQLVLEMGKSREPAARIHALENLSKMMGLAISKNKDTTLAEISDKLAERIWFRERDIEVCSKIFEVMTELFRNLAMANRYSMAFDVVRQFERIRRQVDNLPAERRDAYTSALRELALTATVQAGSTDTVAALVRELESETMTLADQAMKLLEFLGSEEVVTQLLDGFRHPSRSVRNRCFQVLQAIGDKALEVCVWKLKNIDDTEIFRRTGNTGALEDSAFFVARNAIDLVAKLGGPGELEIMRTLAHDEDPRIRRETLANLAKLNEQAAEEEALAALGDPADDVVEVAASVAAQLKASAAVAKLVDLFYARPALRPNVVNALSLIGGDDAEMLLVPATRFGTRGNLAKIYAEDFQLRVTAIRALGALGQENAQLALRRMVSRWSNPVFRLFFFPMRQMFAHKDLIKIARDALGRIDYRLKTA
ncbi:hypothetical protein K8I61_04600 [bacterium]|nr:hypothetical protein [bacterium]